MKVILLLGISLILGFEAPKDKTNSNHNSTVTVTSSDSIPDMVDPVQISPFFNGCDTFETTAEKRECSNEKVLAFISEHLNYPKEAKARKTEGRVIITFTIEKDGSMTFDEDLKKVIIRDPGDGCGQEALRVIKMMPKWIPATSMGKIIAVRYTIPVKFELEKENRSIYFDKDSIPILVSEMPLFPGCDSLGNEEERRECSRKKMNTFIKKNLKYPQSDLCYEGTVVVRIIIGENGQILKSKLLRNPGGGLGKSALDVIKKMPNWIPGKENGKPIKVQMTIPVKFRL